jgi:cytochrome b involved in lipid metabolism
VAAFLDEHPGGRDYILDHSGQDASAIFASDEIHAHSETARQMLRQYRVGVLQGSPAAAAASGGAPRKGQPKELVDLSRAAVPQVLQMGAEYQYWVHHTVGPKGFRIFQTTFFESFSHYPWWYIFFMWVPAIVYTFSMALKHGTHPALAVAMLPAGMLLWTLFEYLLHRFVFHMSTSSGLMNFAHFLLHGIHHLTPTDPNRLAFPPIFGVVLGYSLYSGVVSAFGAGVPQAILSGAFITYLFYDTMHYYFHHGDLPWLPSYFRWMKSRHLDHHFKDENRNYGVTSPLWDWVFGTL